MQDGPTDKQTCRSCFYRRRKEDDIFSFFIESKIPVFAAEYYVSDSAIRVIAFLAAIERSREYLLIDGGATITTLLQIKLVHAKNDP